jgi:hypothetical protein
MIAKTNDQPVLDEMRIIFSILLLSLYMPLQSQIINTNLKISFNLGINNPGGAAYLTNNNAVFPKLYSNMETSIGGDISGIYLFYGNLGAGLSFGAIYMTGWKYNYLEYYKDATALVMFTNPLIYYQTPAIMNERLRFFLNTGPLIARTSVKLEEPVIYIYNNADKLVTDMLSTNNSGVGLGISGGLRFNLNSKTAFSVNCSYRYFNTSSVLYPDNDISSISYGLGVTIMFLKDKKYYF